MAEVFIPCIPFIPVNYLQKTLRQPEAFAALSSLGHDASLAEKILNRSKRFPFVLSIAGNCRDEITQRHRSHLGELALFGFGG